MSPFVSVAGMLRALRWGGVTLGLSALATPCLVAAQSTTKFGYDVLGQMTQVVRGSTITAYGYDAAQNRTGVVVGLNMDPGPGPSGPAASIIVLPLPSGYLLPLGPVSGATAARQASATNTSAEVEARSRAVSLYGVRLDQASSSAPTELLASEQLSDAALLAKRMAILTAQSSSTTPPATTSPPPPGDASNTQARARGLAGGVGRIADDAAVFGSAAPPPSSPLEGDELLRRIVSLATPR